MPPIPTFKLDDLSLNEILDGFEQLETIMEMDEEINQVLESMTEELIPMGAYENKPTFEDFMPEYVYEEIMPEIEATYQEQNDLNEIIDMFIQDEYLGEQTAKYEDMMMQGDVFESYGSLDVLSMDYNPDWEGMTIEFEITDDYETVECFHKQSLKVFMCLFAPLMLAFFVYQGIGLWKQFKLNRAQYLRLSTSDTKMEEAEDDGTVIECNKKPILLKSCIFGVSFFCSTALMIASGVVLLK
jgi:hypothetical protein